MFVCKYVCTCIRVCKCVCTCICIYISCIYKYEISYIRLYIYIYINIFEYTWYIMRGILAGDRWLTNYSWRRPFEPFSCVSPRVSIQAHKMHICIRTYVHTYIHTYIHECKQTQIHTCIHTYIHTNIHAYVHTHTCLHTYVKEFLHVFIHTYDIYTYSYMHINMHVCSVSQELFGFRYFDSNAFCRPTSSHPAWRISESANSWHDAVAI